MDAPRRIDRQQIVGRVNRLARLLAEQRPDELCEVINTGVHTCLEIAGMPQFASVIDFDRSPSVATSAVNAAIRMVLSDAEYAAYRKRVDPIFKRRAGMASMGSSPIFDRSLDEQRLQAARMRAVCRDQGTSFYNRDVQRELANRATRNRGQVPWNDEVDEATGLTEGDTLFELWSAAKAEGEIDWNAIADKLIVAFPKSGRRDERQMKRQLVKQRKKRGLARGNIWEQNVDGVTAEEYLWQCLREPGNSFLKGGRRVFRRQVILDALNAHFPSAVSPSQFERKVRTFRDQGLI